MQNSAMSKTAPTKIVPMTLEDAENCNDPEQDSADASTLDSHLSLRLALLVRRDQDDKLEAALEAANIPTDQLLHQRLAFYKPDDGKAEFFRLHHLAVHYSAGRTLAFLVRKCLDGSCCWKSLAALDDADGSNILHSLAKARVMREGRGSGPSETELAGLDKFESDVFEILAEVGEPNCGCDVESAICCGLPFGEEKPKSFLHALCLMENTAGLRPLEFAMQIGAYTTFQKIVEVDNYIKIDEHVIGIRVYKRYNLSEYDVTSGVRRSKAPILILNQIRIQQVSALRRSNLMQSGLLVDKWINLMCSDLKWTYLLVSLVFGVLFFQLTPLSLNFNMIVTMAQHAYELNKGFYEFANKIKGTYYSHMNETFLSNANIEAAVRSACHPDNLVSYLSNGSRGAESLKTSPIYFYSVDRDIVMSNITINQYIIAFLLCAELAVMLFGVAKGTLAQRSPLYRIDRCFNINGEYFVKNEFISFSIIAMLFCGLQHLSGSMVLMRYLDCTEVVMGRAKVYKNNWAIHITESGAVMYMFFAMLCFTSGFELKFKRFAFLGICFRKMFSRFMAAVPLFLVWAYFVFGTLFFMVDFENSEFESHFSVFYSPLRIFLNTANLSTRPSTAMLHTMFVLIVTINIQNFLIAYVSNEFNIIAANFDLVHQLTRFDHVAITGLMFGDLLRLWRRFIDRFRKTERNQFVETVEITFAD